MRDATSITPAAERLLAEARGFLDTADEADRRGDSAKWAAAERMWRANREEGVTQAAIAERVGRTPSGVSKYVRIWEEYGRDVHPAERMTFTGAYYAFMPQASTEARAERFAAKHLRDAAPAERARVVADLLGDDAVVDRVVAESPEAALRVMGAADRAAAERAPEPRAEPVDRLAVLVQLRYVRRKLAEVLGTLQAAPAIPEDMRDNLRAEVEWLRNAVDLIGSATEGRGWDAALADLLAGGV